MFAILIFGIPFVLTFIVAYLQYVRREKLKKNNSKTRNILTFLGVYFLVFVVIVAIAINDIHC